MMTTKNDYSYEYQESDGDDVKENSSTDEITDCEDSTLYQPSESRQAFLDEQKWSKLQEQPESLDLFHGDQILSSSTNVFPVRVYRRIASYESLDNGDEDNTESEGLDEIGEAERTHNELLMCIDEKILQMTDTVNSLKLLLNHLSHSGKCKVKGVRL